MKILVQKFGGSSVSDEEKREKVISKIIGAQKAGYAVVVVLSAMGRHPEPYATDTLIRLIENGGDQKVCPRDKDLLMSCGEVISCVVLAQMLRDRGVKAVSLTGWQAGFITDGNFCEAKILRIEPEMILDSLQAGKIPIVAGFQGISEKGEITTLGRGGSDTTATALGAALKADSVEIYTDVDGILAADPSLLDNPRKIPQMHYMEAGEMASEGAKVLHKRCVAPAEKFEVPLRVKSALADSPGTLICSEIEKEALERRRVVTSIVHVPDMAQIEVDLIDAADRSKIRLTLLKMMGEKGISLDLINIVRERLYFIVNENRVGEVAEICEQMDLPLKIVHNCSKVSCIGIGMKGTPGVMAAIQEALADAGVNVLHATDSHITISCLIKSKDLKKAASALSKKFRLEEE